MQKDCAAIAACALFRGVAAEDLSPMLQCLDARRREYRAGEAALAAGDMAARFGVVLSGRFQVTRGEYSGSRAILAVLEAGELFGEAFACAAAAGAPQRLPVTVECAQDGAALLIDASKIARTCPGACPRHQRLIENLLWALAEKNIHLNRRIGLLAKRATREKILSYLAQEAARQGGPAFDIPLNRQELADYLCVDRSALSAALSALRDEGALSFRKNHFELHAFPRGSFCNKFP